MSVYGSLSEQRHLCLTTCGALPLLIIQNTLLRRVAVTVYAHCHYLPFKEPRALLTVFHVSRQRPTANEEIKISFTKWPFFDFCQLTYRKLQKPSLEVEPTTLRLMLFIYSFQFSSAFPPTCSNWFSQFHSLSAEKKHFLSRDLELWPVTLSYDQNRVETNHRVKYLGQLIAGAI